MRQDRRSPVLVNVALSCALAAACQSPRIGPRREAQQAGGTAVEITGAAIDGTGRVVVSSR